MTEPAPPVDKPAQLPRLIASKCIQRKVLAAELEEILASRGQRADTDVEQVQEALEAVRGRKKEPRTGSDTWFGWALSASSWWHGERPADPDHDPEHPIVPPHCGLVGLALSGGGIRSASVCLGVLQALAKADKLRFIDYLSTVSGGGYVGSSWTALLSQPRTTVPRPDFPFIHRNQSPEPAREERGLDPVALVHIRDFANYLMPRGLRDQVRAPALLLGGIIINAVLILPFLLLLAAATLWRYGGDLRQALDGSSIGKLPGLEWTIYLLWISLAFLVGAAAYQKGRAWFARVLEQKAPETLLNRFHRIERRCEDLRQSQRKRSTLVALGISLLDLLPLPARSNWRFRRRLLGYGSILFIALALVALFELQQYAIYAFASDNIFWRRANLWGGLGTLAGLLSAGVAGKLATADSPRIRKVVFVMLGLLGPLALWLVYLSLCRIALTLPEFYLWEKVLPWLNELPRLRPETYQPMGWAGMYVAWAIALWMLSTIMIDANITSLHSFYRDRLSRAFMLQLNRDGEHEWRVFHEDDVLLSHCAASRSQSGGPYHIINATVNSPDFCDENRIGDESQRGRRADFFIFSPRYCGNERLGYCATDALEAADSHMNLGTAMAISAAAAAPNMGQNTFGPLGVFLLGMLNIRLGYWLRTPRAVNENLFTIPVGPIHYLLELIGIPPRGKRAHVNLSDGGHLDNLGIFELLRRRCQYIIAIDAEADPTMSFNGLAIVQRLARTDLGVEIHFDVEDLRKEKGLSRRHFALCRIDYGDGHGGELLYIKSSLTGTEIEYIKEYQRRQPAFPHESTGDQFFDETQFEAYRALGHEMGEELVANRYADGRPARRPSERDTVAEFFAELRSWLRPAAPFHDDFLQLSKRRLDLDSHLHDLDSDLHKEQLASYLDEIYDWPIGPRADGDAAANGDVEGSGESREAAEHGRNWEHEPHCVNVRLLQLVNEQIQLMEQAVLALHLNERRNQEHPRNRGWMNLFRRWSRSAEFQKYWAVSIANYSDTLLVFCKYALRLEFDCFWQDHGEATRAEDLFLRKFDDSERWFGFVAPRPPEADVDTYDPRHSVLKTCVAVAAIDRATDAEPELRTFRIRRPYRNLRLSEALLHQLPSQVQAIHGVTTDQSWVYRLDDDPELRESTTRLKRILSRHKQFREATETNMAA